MSESTVLQAILDGQTVIRNDIKRIEGRLDKTEERLVERIDKLGLQIANLEDDAPTIEEFEKLEKRVSKLERQAPKN